MSAHTAEPWHFFGDMEKAQVQIRADGIVPNSTIVDPAAVLVLAVDIDPVNPNLPQVALDLMRAVQCVNACKGAPESVLVTLGARGGFENAIAILMKQRDELAGTLRKHSDYQTEMEKAGFGAYSATELCAITDAALAKVTA